MNKPLSPVLRSNAELRNPERTRSVPNDHIPPEPQRQQTERMRTIADGGEDSEQYPGLAEDLGMSSEATRNEAEQFRRLAEEAREVRDHHRDALEQSDRSESDYGTPLRRRAPPARRHGARPRLRVKPWWMRCAPPPRP